MGDDRLESWKEIAAYLGREVRTVQLWEKSEGLPIHRQQHARQGSVYAFKPELDAWRASRKTAPVDRSKSPSVWGWTGIAAALVVAVVAFATIYARRPERVSSIVVLPFSDFSPGHDQEYFSDGLTEEIIDALSGVPNLRVVARTSAFAFKGRSNDIRDIGRQLNVAAVLEGSVRKTATGFGSRRNSIESPMGLTCGPEPTTGSCAISSLCSVRFRRPLRRSSAWARCRSARLRAMWRRGVFIGKASTSSISFSRRNRI